MSQCCPPATVLRDIYDNKHIIYIVKYPNIIERINPHKIVKEFDIIINIEYSYNSISSFESFLPILCAIL